MSVKAQAELHKIDAITEKVIGCAYTVSNSLGCGFVEKVYENAMAHELRKAGMNVQQQYPIRVYYDAVVVGEFVADLLVEETVIVELKAVKEFDDIHMAQCMNYLKATGLPMCLLINFGKPHVDIKRIINQRESLTTDEHRYTQMRIMDLELAGHVKILPEAALLSDSSGKESGMITSCCMAICVHLCSSVVTLVGI